MKKWYFVLSAIILFNPIVSIFDIFPDFIAYLLLLKAFHNMAYIDDKADDTCKYLKIMALITLIKPFTFFIVPSGDSTMYLLYSFVFAVLEIIFGFALFTKMFETLSAYALNAQNIKAAENTKIKNFTIAAHILKLAFAFLPDLTALSITNGVDTQTGIPLTNFKTALFFVAVVISLIIQTVWFVRISVYNKRVFTPELNALLKDQFIRQTENRPSLFLSKDSMFVIVSMCLASAFVIDFNLNMINVIFDSFFSVSVFLLFLYLFIKKHFKDTTMLLALGALSIAHLIVDIYLTKHAKAFFDKYTLSMLEKYLYDSREMYLQISILSVISAILFFAVVFLVMYLLRKQGEKALTEYSLLLVQSDVDGLLSEYKSATKKYTISALVSAGIASACYVIYITTRSLATIVTVVNSLAEIAFIFVFVRAILYYYDNVYKRLYIHS